MRKASVSRAVRTLGLVALLICSGCLGPNHATGRLVKFNSQVENKFARQGAFLLLLPAYLIVGIGDNFVFNSIYWWTGDNPIDPPGGSGPKDLGL